MSIPVLPARTVARIHLAQCLQNFQSKNLMAFFSILCSGCPPASSLQTSGMYGSISPASINSLWLEKLNADHRTSGVFCVCFLPSQEPKVCRLTPELLNGQGHYCVPSYYLSKSLSLPIIGCLIISSPCVCSFQPRIAFPQTPPTRNSRYTPMNVTL